MNVKFMEVHVHGLLRDMFTIFDKIKLMDLKAELVLHDCIHAIQKHNLNLQGEDFRTSWWTIISLLRAVGHVLSKVDSDISAKHKLIIAKAYKELKESYPEPRIFWGFIEEERNRFLKEYKYGVRRQYSASTEVNGLKKSVSVGLDDLSNAIITPDGPGAKMESFITSGPFAGNDEYRVALTAAAWWKNYLNNIKAQL